MEEGGCPGRYVQDSFGSDSFFQKMDEIHMLKEDRGHALEAAVCR
jgi:hypothetical protein